MSRRLLVVGPLPPPPGGGETVTRVLTGSALAERYDLRHFDITRRHGKEDMGRFTPRNALWALRFAGGLRQTLREFRPELVHLPAAFSNAPLLRDRLFASLVRRSGARLVLHPHGGVLGRRYPRAGWMWKRLVRAHLSRCDAIICFSPRWQRFFDRLELGVRTEVIANPLDPEILAAIENATARPRPHPGVRVLFVGAVCEPKGIPELLDALEIVIENQPDLEARIVGGKQYRGHFERIAARHQRMRARERVALAGPRFGVELAEEYASADLFVLPSRFEAMPMALVEAMAAGLPVVATRVGSVPDMIQDGVQGILVDPGDVEGLATALGELARDPERRRAMGEKNRVAARAAHAEPVFVEACDRLYRSILD